MSEGLPRVAHVLMPERGMFLVCLPEGFDSPYGTRCIVQLDYGEDVAEVRCAATYDPEIHGPRIPGFRLIRPLAPEDAERLAANERLAESMCVTFQKLAAADGHAALRIVHRDEVSLTGALGPCGRRCCCCDWQARYPQGLTGDRVRAQGGSVGAPNGICGRYRCCLAFE